MNKKLLPVVIGAAIAGGYMTTAAADVQLYGLLDVSIDHFDYDSGWGYGDDINMNTRTSYLGVKGSEDLGNGVKAIFKMEYTIAGGPSESGGLNSGRDQWVGLQGDFGTVRVGSMATHYKDTGGGLNVMADTAFDLRGVSGYDNDFFQFGFMSSLHDGTGEDGEGRADNSVRYDTPDFNGFSAGFHYTFDSCDDNGPCGGDGEDPWGVGAQYKNDSIYAFAAYITNELPSAGAFDENDAWKVGGSYTMGNASVFAQYEQGGLVGFEQDDGDNQWMLGGTYTMGNTMLMGAYGQAEAEIFGSDEEMDIWQLAVKHSMSKRTALYAGFNQSDTDGVGEIDHFAVGVQHKF